MLRGAGIGPGRECAALMRALRLGDSFDMIAINVVRGFRSVRTFAVDAMDRYTTKLPSRASKALKGAEWYSNSCQIICSGEGRTDMYWLDFPHALWTLSGFEV
jgi:hypothetical protein